MKQTMPRKNQKAERPSPAQEQNYNTEDCVETASVDSFPASDPPGWICTKAKAQSADQSDDRPPC